MWRIQGRGLRTRYHPLFLDQTTEAWRAPLPPYLRVWMTAGLPPTPSTSPCLKVWMCHWRVIVEAALWVKLLKVFFRLKQLNSLSGKKIPYHFWNLHNSFKMRYLLDTVAFEPNLLFFTDWQRYLHTPFSKLSLKYWNKLGTINLKTLPTIPYGVDACN